MFYYMTVITKPSLVLTSKLVTRPAKIGYKIICIQILPCFLIFNLKY